MNCERFESMLADALGGELSAEDQSLFDAHTASCDMCRGGFEADREAVEALRRLPGPQRLQLERDIKGTHRKREPGSSRLRSSATARRSAFSFAAAILISFTAGYGSHAVLMIDRVMDRPSSQEAADSASVKSREPDSLASALAMVHQRDPARSDLAKCMIAMFDGSKN